MYGWAVKVLLLKILLYSFSAIGLAIIFLVGLPFLLKIGGHWEGEAKAEWADILFPGLAIILFTAIYKIIHYFLAQARRDKALADKWAEAEYPSFANDEGLTVVLDGVKHSFPKHHPNYKAALVAHGLQDKETLLLLSESGRGL